MNIRFRPLPTWPHPSTPAYNRRSAHAFRAGWNNTLNLLERELFLLKADTVLIGAGFTEADIRRDGMPRGDARAIHPGVEVSFDSPHGRLVYATDACELWQHNVRSIALGLEALRAVDRYGITRRGEQYAGWRQLTAGPADGAMTLAEAETLIARYGNVRKALLATHPDRGGDPEEFARVQRARQMVEGSGLLCVEVPRDRPRS